MLLDKLLSNITIRVERFAVCRVAPHWRLSLPGPQQLIVHFVLEGRGSVRGGSGISQSVGPASMVVVPLHTAHALEGEAPHHEEFRVPQLPERGAVPLVIAGEGEPMLHVACGTVHVSYGSSLGLFDHLDDVLVSDLSDSPAVNAAFAGILAEQQSPQPGGHAMTEALMSQCFVALLRRLCTDGSCALPWLAALEDARLARAIDAILEDPGAPHSVGTLADLAGMSRSSFAEGFQSAFGRPPMTLLRHVRLQRAALLLADPAHSVDEVASMVGFSSRSHFSRVFKQHHGVSPGAFRA